MAKLRRIKGRNNPKTLGLLVLFIFSLFVVLVCYFAYQFEVFEGRNSLVDGDDKLYIKRHNKTGKYPIIKPVEKKPQRDDRKDEYDNTDRDYLENLIHKTE